MSDTPGSDKPASPGSDDGVSAYSDKVYRSTNGVAGGLFLLALLLFLAIDAMVSGSGRAPFTAAAVLVAGVPLIAAFTVWPQVRSGEKRLLVRNPFRTIDAPWGTVESLTAALSVELRAGGRKFVIWALPVSLRQRKKAGRKAMIAAGDRATMGGRPKRRDAGGLLGGGFGGFGGCGSASAGRYGSADPGPTQAYADQAVSDINEHVEEFRKNNPAAAMAGEVRVTWTWPIIAPLVAGVIALVVILATG